MKINKKQENKELKEALKSEISPLLIGLRNELKGILVSIQDQIQIKQTPDGNFVAVSKGAKGDKGNDAVVDYKRISEILEKSLPKKDIDYLTPKQLEKMIKELKPRAGVDYCTEKEMDEWAEKIIKRATPIKGVHYRDGEKGIDGKTIIKEVNLTSEELLEKLTDGIPASMIIGLEKLITKIAANLQPWQRGQAGLGSSASSAIPLVPLNETPVGLIDGSNKTYTVSQVIRAIIGVWVNGQYIHPTYSFSGNQLIMQAAIPAALSGKPFSIVYV